MLFCVSEIATRNDTSSTSDVLGDSLDICGTIISSLKCSPRIPLTKLLFSAIIEALFFLRNIHKNMVLRATPYPILKETVTGCPFTTKGFL